jgi:hypothetical protein
MSIPNPYQGYRPPTQYHTPYQAPQHPTAGGTQQQQPYGRGGPNPYSYDPASGMYTSNGMTPTQQQVLDLMQQQPLPADLSAFYGQMQNMYGGAMGTAQQYYQQMQDYANQLNSMLGQDVGAQEHNQLMALNQPVQHQNSMTYFYGY